MRLGGCLTILLLAAAVAIGAAAAAPAPPTQAQVQAAVDACKAQGLTPDTTEFRQCVGKALAAALGGGQGGGGQKPPAQPSTPSQGAPPTAPPGAQAAVDACKGQGLSPGSDAFNACIKAYYAQQAKKPNQLTPKQQAAVDACKAKGLAMGSDAFTECIKEMGNAPAPNAQAQAALDGCKASGVAQGTDAFKECVKNATIAAATAGFTGEQIAALNVCRAQGFAVPSAELLQCLSKVLTKLVPGQKNDVPAVKDVQGAVAACQAQQLSGQSLVACVKAKLNS